MREKAGRDSSRTFEIRGLDQTKYQIRENDFSTASRNNCLDTSNMVIAHTDGMTNKGGIDEKIYRIVDYIMHAVWS